MSAWLTKIYQNVRTSTYLPLILALSGLAPCTTSSLRLKVQPSWNSEYLSHWKSVYKPICKLSLPLYTHLKAHIKVIVSLTLSSASQSASLSISPTESHLQVQYIFHWKPINNTNLLIQPWCLSLSLSEFLSCYIISTSNKDDNPLRQDGRNNNSHSQGSETQKCVVSSG
jgi:hypothetical protein